MPGQEASRRLHTAGMTHVETTRIALVSVHRGIQATAAAGMLAGDDWQMRRGVDGVLSGASLAHWACIGGDADGDLLCAAAA